MASEIMSDFFEMSIRTRDAGRRSEHAVYAEPGIIRAFNAVAAIHGSKYHGHLLECASDVYRCSPGAYEADE